MSVPPTIVVVPPPIPAPELLRIFISYASEDIPIATAIFKCLRSALGEFSEINIDRSFMEAGQGFREQIKARLEQSRVFISLYLGVDKQWPAWEIGYFERLMNEDAKRQLVPFYLESPPASISHYQGFLLGILPKHLQGSQEEFTRFVATIDQNHPICRFVANLRGIADGHRAAAGFPKAQRDPEQEPVVCVQRMMQEIFNHLRTTVEATFRPQKQIFIRTTDAALEKSKHELPSDARLIPIGVGDPMSIFGLTAVERTWQSFLKEAERDEHLESWRASIVSVITSSLDSSINIDNSQIIVASNGETAYRVILTSANKYYDGKREFSLYFVEMLRREDFGDQKTSLLLRAIDITCRFRSMFFEKGTPFSSIAVGLSSVPAVLNAAAKLVRELNLLRKDARDAGLDTAAVWLTLVDAEAFKTIVEIYQPLENKIRDVAGRILESRANPDAIPDLQNQLSAVLKELEQKAEAGNARLIHEMTAELSTAALRKSVPAKVAVVAPS